MRFALVALALTACSQPQAEIAGREPALSEMTYVCTEEGNLIVRWDFAEGGYQESMTGETCDYEAWRADVAANGPVYSRRSRL